MSYAVGALVKARGREWVVLPSSDDALLIVRPLGGADDEITGILTALEMSSPPNSICLILPARRLPPCHLPRTLCASASAQRRPVPLLGKIAVEPRPYQLTPLLMALKLDPVQPAHCR